MKVYVVWSVPDYEGIDIEGIFLNKCDAEKLLNELRSNDPQFPDWYGIEEYDVK